MRWRVASPWAVLAVILASRPAPAQTYSQRGFVDVRGAAFPEDAPNDSTPLTWDLLAREDVFAKPRPWLQFALGVDLRANTHDQVDPSWTPDLADRRVRRPRLSARRLGATLTHGALTVDLGRQFIRWGKTDITTPTDRFAPRDFLNGVDADVLAVSGARAVVQHGSDTLDIVWVPIFTPSRVPLLDQRWTTTGADTTSLRLVDGGASLPDRSQVGVRWSRTAAIAEYSVSFFDGVNHLPTFDVGAPRATATGIEIGVARRYPPLRAYGVDAAVPTRWATLKGEASYVTSSDASSDEYVLYAVQAERQVGEWLIIAGYSGEAVVERRASATFAPDRGLSRAVVGRVSYAIDTNRSVVFETAVRQNGAGAYAKGEYSEAHGQHWRTTVGAVLFRGDPDDFLGQYRRNSHVTLALRYSF